MDPHFTDRELGVMHWTIAIDAEGKIVSCWVMGGP